MALEVDKPLKAARALVQSVLNGPMTQSEALEAARLLVELHNLRKGMTIKEWEEE